MKKKLFMLLALVMTAMTASAYDLTVGTSEHGTITFKIDGTTATSANENDVVTVEITPDAGYVVNQPSGQWYAASAGAPNRAASIDLLKDVDLTPVTGQENQWQFTMKRANVEISATYKKLLTNTDITVQDITALTYNGEAQEPTVTVKDGTTTLVLNTDYTVSYSNNTNAALSTAATAPTVTITAVSTSEKYAGTTSKTFSIEKKALTVTADDKTATYGDAAPEYTVSYDGLVGNETETVLGGTLALACDYVQNQSGVGEYTITPSGLTSSNYEITFAEGTLTVGAKALEDAFIADIDALTYNGQAQTPAPVLTFNGMTLAESTDYTLAYENNVNAGTATVTATGTGNYSGTAQKTFTINPAALTAATLQETNFTYNQQEQTAQVATVTAGTLNVSSSEYDVTGNKATNVGTYTATITGKGNFKGSVTAQFSIVAADANLFELTLDPAEFTYNGQEQKPTVTVKDGDATLTEGTDYELAFTDAINAGTVTVTATGKGNYTGTKTATYTITPATLTTATLVETNFTYNQQEQTAQVATVTAGTLTVPTEGYDVTENTATNVGNYTATITGKGNYTGEVKAQFSIIAANANLFELTLNPTEFTYNSQEQKPTVTVKDGDATLTEGTDYELAFTDAINAGTVTVTATGKGNYTGTKTATYVINPAVLTEVTLAETSLVYNQYLQTVSVSSVKAGELNVLESDYEVTGNSGTDVGTYTVTVTGKNNFTGEVTAQFSIVAADATALFDITLDNDVFDADGTEKQPVVTVKDGNATLVAGTDYTVSYQDNVKVGTATVTVTGQGNYEGTKTAPFTIVRDMSTVFSEGNNWTTYVAQEDLTLPEGIEAYAVTGATATEVSAEAISYIPAGIGILLNRSDVATTEFKGYAYEGTTATIESLLVGSATEATDMTTYKDFALYRDEFVLSGTASVAAGHAYLPAAAAPAGAARRSIVISGKATGVSQIENGELTIEKWYDLNGRKLQTAPTKKGIYIRNGKKVVIK